MGTIALIMNSIWGNHRKLAARLTMPLLLAIALVACGGNGAVKTPPAGNKPPVAAFTLTPAGGAAPLEVKVDAGGSTDPDGRITSYAWEFGDGAKATGVTASHTYSGPGKHTVTLTVTDDEGATDQRQAAVTVTAPPANQAPTAAFSVTPESGAAPLEVELDASASSDPDGSITVYAWEFGDGEKGDGVAVSHTYGEPGEYTVTLTVTDDKGATAERQATVKVADAGEENQAPRVDFSFTPAGGEAPLEVEFSAGASYDPDGTITRYDWEFGDGASKSSGSSPITRHTYLEAGDYTVTLTVTDDRGATGQRTRQVKVLPPRGENQPPIAAFYIWPEEGGEAPLTVEVDATPTADPDGWINRYAWDFGGGESASGRSASHTFTTPGEHTITLTVTDNEGASASSSQSVTVTEPTPKNQPPVASFTVTPHAGFVPLEVAFDASTSSDPDGSITSYAWDFGDGGTASGAQVTHTYTEAGHYTAKLTVTDDEGATARHSYAVTAQPKLNVAPVAQISATALSGLPGLTVTFDASGSYDPDGSIVSYEWHIGGRWDYIGPVITHTFEETGSFSVFLTVYDDKGYPGTKSVSVLVYSGDYNLPPNAQFTATPYRGEAPLVVEFDASASFDYDGSIVSYDWDFGDGAVGGGVRATHTYEAAGEYSVTLTVTDDAGDKASRHTIVSVDPAPIGWELNPLFTVGIVAFHDIKLNTGHMHMDLWAGGVIRVRSVDEDSGYQTHAGIDMSALNFPFIHFPEQRDQIIVNLLADRGETDLEELCAGGLEIIGMTESVPSFTPLVCLSDGANAILEGTYPEIIVIGDADTTVRLQGDIGNEAGSSVLISGRLINVRGSLTGDVTILTADPFSLDSDLRGSSTGARPVIIAEQGLDIVGNRGEEANAIVWGGGDIVVRGVMPLFRGTIVTNGSVISNSSGLGAFSLPGAIDNPYLPKVPIY